ncbi:MAG: trigger factor [bacterium]|nr:trigger factor [bacterium]
MKKWMKMACVGTLAAAMLFTGCSNKSQNAEESTSVSESDTTEAVEADGLSKITTLGNYKGIEVEKRDTSVTDEEVQDQLDIIVANNPTMEEVTNRAIAEGDTVNLTYVGTQEDGTEFDNGTVDLVIGSGQFIDGFEDGLIGANIGDEVTLNLTFPEDYFETSLAGQPAVFAVTIHSISVQTDAVLDDAFVDELTSGEYTTVDAYRQYLREIMEDQNEQAAEQEMLYAILEQVAAESEFELSDADVAATSAEIRSYYDSMASAYGITIETLTGKTTEEVEEIIQQGSEQTLQWNLILEKIAEEEKVELTEEDYENFAVDNGYGSLEQLRSLADEDEIREVVLIEKITPILLDYATINESEAAQ